MLGLQAFSVVKEFLHPGARIAVVGFSPKPHRPSHMVGRYLMDAGFVVYPVNPGVNEILGRKSYPDLASIEERIDIVDVFRRSADVLPIAEAAVAIGAKVLWLQQGIINEEAEKLAREAGLKVVMDRCLQVDHANVIRN